MIALKNVTLRHGARTVFDGLDLALTQPRIGLIGDNGAGKSSLFRLICGLDEPTAGRVLIDGCSAREHAVGNVGMMFQNPDEQIVFPTVAEELAFSLTAMGVPRREAQPQARQFLVERGLGAWAERAVSSLSQGQRQHVCWLALMIASPGLLLLDEPFASLDLVHQALLQREIDEAEQHIIVATHALDHVRNFERVVWLEQGRVRADDFGRDVCAAYEADVAHRMAAHRMGWAEPVRTATSP